MLRIKLIHFSKGVPGNSLILWYCTYLSPVFTVTTKETRYLYMHNTLQCHHNERDGISNHRCLDCLLNRLFRRRSKKTSKLRVIGLCEGNSPGTGEFPAQRASNAENVSIWWRHHHIPRIMHTVHALLCLVVLRYRPISPITFRVTSAFIALRQP